VDDGSCKVRIARGAIVVRSQTTLKAHQSYVASFAPVGRWSPTQYCAFVVQPHATGWAIRTPSGEHPWQWIELGLMHDLQDNAFARATFRLESLSDEGLDVDKLPWRLTFVGGTGRIGPLP
jgi:hypothetical protein